jgi:UDP-N-acetylglucosamine--N-acetylmuramyl-(pentapeptide) pyrophosphoryl-undecaprenol N-acetylglucosamine transferase
LPTCYLFAGGGTGGHLTPGLAVAAELRQRDSDCRIVFAGTDRPLELRLIASAGYERIGLPVESTQMLLRNPFRFATRNFRAYRLAQRLLDLDRADGVIGLGGFASMPTVLAATRRNIPTILLEQNAIPGRATRFLSRHASTVCTAFQATENVLKSGARVEVTGNPVRAEIAELSHRSCQSDTGAQRTLLVLGGSQGAESLNGAVMRMLERHPLPLAGWQIVHQTGAAQHLEMERRYRAAHLTAVVAPFFDDMPARYASATLVVSRAGATTLAELACAACPAILLPYPHAVDNHQLANARLVESAGAAIVILHDSNPEATRDHLADAVAALAADAPRRAAMQQQMRQLARPDAARNVVDILQSLIAESRT